MRRSKIGAMLGAVLLSLITPAAATAVGPPGGNDGGVQYYWLDCPAGTASTGTITDNLAESNFLYLRYTVTPCAMPSSTTAMAVAFYYPDGHTNGTAYIYAPNAWHHVHVPPGAQATCLLAGPQNRLDCYEVVWDLGWAGAGQRISPADPRVQAIPAIELYLLPRDGDGDPYCPLCTL